jgi:hypothetical protein
LRPNSKDIVHPRPPTLVAHPQPEKAVIPVVPLQKQAFLMAVHPVVGGVKIEDPPPGGFAE